MSDSATHADPPTQMLLLLLLQVGPLHCTLAVDNADEPTLVNTSQQTGLAFLAALSVCCSSHPILSLKGTPCVSHCSDFAYHPH